MDLTPLFTELLRGFTNFSLGNAVMIVVGLILIYLAVAKGYEPVLLLPIGFGCILANLGLGVNMAPAACSTVSDQNILTVLYLSLIHISEPTRLGMISYAVFCLKKKKKKEQINTLEK